MTSLARIEWRVKDVVRERGQIIEQGADAMHRKAIRAKPGGVLRFRQVRMTKSLEHLSDGEPQCADRDGQDGQWRAHFEVGPEADLDVLRARPLHDDQIGNRSQDREVASQGGRHCHREPGVLLVLKLCDEGFQHQDRGYVAYDVGEHRSDAAQDRQPVELQAAHRCDDLRRQV